MRWIATGIAALAALAAALGFDYAVLAPIASDIAAGRLRGESREKPLNCWKPFRRIPPDLQVRLQVIPDSQQRYETAGDWQWKDDTLEILVSREVDERDPRYATLLFVHELIEALLCRSTGVSAAEVDSFDISHPQETEPGNNSGAPYHQQHMAAEAAEKALAGRMGVVWKDYLAGLQ